MSESVRISFVMATYNRRDVVLATLHRLYCLGMSPRETEIIVVDNASSDGTAAAVARRFPEVRLVALRTNYGACGKAFGVDVARGEFVVFLDDDSYPRPGSIQRMVYKFECDPGLGAASFMAHLPDGRCECCALPDVFIGCGVGIRKAALEAVGGLDRNLFMAAEEYDLSFRLVGAGWGVRTFTDLHVDHLKSPTARSSARLVYHDTRNNLYLVARYLPDPWARVYRADWALRYGWIAAAAGQRRAYWRGRLRASADYRAQRRRHARYRLEEPALESLFAHQRVAREMRRLAEAGAQRVVLADFGKNIYPFMAGARAAGLEITAIGDDFFAAPGRYYRGLPLVPLTEALCNGGDAVVIANASPVHAMRTENRLRSLTERPILRWFGYDVDAPHGASSPSAFELQKQTVSA